ncbi:MAG: molecular chaperone HtpG [Planctomycetota bacterium]|nr:molecular chaperone HtpG [Planctomycetota bacterium]
MTTAAGAETRRFEAETQELLGLVIHSLYTEKDIFLRELVSNASDALDKLRHEALTNDDLAIDDETLAIHLEVDKDARTLTIADNGIGMTKDELATNLGTIAQSGTRRFLDELKKAGAEKAPELIGQFGVGFYSSFMIADEVVVTSRRVGTQEGARWRSTADGTFTIEDAEVASHGTTIVLHLKPEDPTEKEPQDFLSPWAIRAIVKRYSDFVEYPITMDVESVEPVLDDEGKPKEGETQTVVNRETLNSRKPLWARAKKDVTDEEHAEFYRHITHDFTEPFETLHFTAESPVEYTALLYLPKKRPFDLFQDPKRQSRLSLYVKRVLIMPECEDLLPPWLRFVRGIVDCPDLPLNVSRQTLQANPITSKIRRHLVSKVLRGLKDRLKKDREAYGSFFEDFGAVLKEGIYHGEDDDNRISDVCLFSSTHGDEPVTLAEYVERMPEDQEAIYYITGLDTGTLAASPHLEAYKAAGQEVLLLGDPVDEWMLQRLATYKEKPLTGVHQGDAAVESETDKAAREKQQEEHKDLLETLQKHLDDEISDVRFSSRLKESPAVLVSEQGSMGPAMEQVMKDLGRDMPASRRVLELNAEHAVVQRLVAMHGKEPDGQLVLDFADLLHGQAVLAEGRPPSDPVRFAKLVADLMLVASSDED